MVVGLVVGLGILTTVAGVKNLVPPGLTIEFNLLLTREPEHRVPGEIVAVRGDSACRGFV